MSLSQRDAHLLEIMDDPHCDPVLLRRTLRRFRFVNRAVSRWDRVYRTHLHPVLSDLDRPARILDIGCGGGDVLRRIVALAHRDGFATHAMGIDPDPRALEVARNTTSARDITFCRADSQALVAAGERFDIVISNHLLHHLGTEFDDIIADSTALSSRLCVHSDIARSRRAYFAYASAVIPLAPGSFLRADGLRSIRRSYTRAELQARLPPPWSVEKVGAFRLLAVRRDSDAASAASNASGHGR